MKIINLTQHKASDDQKKEGVFDPADHEAVKSLLTISKSDQDIADRASKLAQIAKDSGADAAMIGGAPFLMSSLVMALRQNGIQPLYAFSERVSQDGPNGTKISVFRHAGWRTPEGACI